MTRWLIVTFAAAALCWAGSLYLWGHAELLPERVPTHWGIDGKPNQFTPRSAMLPQLLIFPGVLTGFALLTVVLPWLSPKPFSLDEWRPTYEYIMAIAACLLAYIHFLILASFLEMAVDLGRWLFGGLFLFFAVLGNALGKVRRNFYVGVRTPWTLASQVVWERTHRFAAWFMASAGLLGAVLVLVGVPFWCSLTLLLVAALTPVLFSLVIYKKLEREGKLETPANAAS